eukprot:TRINITY_DN8233_c0_g1_i2.p1 TRINITY_DN8233_c0_g1~~TRINITY_DN8233_c0_g1_i2.p1  ORF type:complete len:371 (-),score=91.54 TRINITY_DN8233_c0_g1_i2:149-1261(-)
MARGTHERAVSSTRWAPSERYRRFLALTAGACAATFAGAPQHAVAWLSAPARQRCEQTAAGCLAGTSLGELHCAVAARDEAAVTCHYVAPENIMRPSHDFSSKWNPRNRKQTRKPEEARQILLQTGRMPRPLLLRDVKFNRPMKKTVVATAEERRRVAKMIALFAVTKLHARLFLRRETHPVWGHERIMVYGKLVCSYLQPCPNTNEPMDITFPLKFKAAFRENADPFFPSIETQWNKQLAARGIDRPDLLEGRMIEQMLRDANDEDVPENMFAESILDNVVDLGELVLQHFVVHVDKQATNEKSKKSRLQERQAHRMQKRFNIDCAVKVSQDPNHPNWQEEVRPSPQETYDKGAYWRAKWARDVTNEPA